MCKGKDMKKVMCQQAPSLSADMLEKVSGGKGYDGCTSKPKKLHKAMTKKGNSTSIFNDHGYTPILMITPTASVGVIGSWKSTFLS